MRLALPIVRCVGTFKAIASSGYALHVWPSAPSCSEGYKVAILEPRHANDRSAEKELSAYRTGGRVIHRATLDVTIRTEHSRQGILYRVIDIVNRPSIRNDRDVANLVGPVDATPGHDREDHRVGGHMLSTH